jgi:hypothetical protein
MTALLLTAADPEIAAVSIGRVFVCDALIEAARSVTAPVDYRIPWDDREFDRTAAITLFDAFASMEKTLHAHSGGHPSPPSERDAAARFFAHHLGRSAEGASA